MDTVLEGCLGSELEIEPSLSESEDDSEDEETAKSQLVLSILEIAWISCTLSPSLPTSSRRFLWACLWRSHVVKISVLNSGTSHGS